MLNFFASLKMCKTWNFIYRLGVDETKPSFIYNNDKVFMFADSPHLVKLLRNHFVSTGFRYKRAHSSKEPLVELLSISDSTLTTSFKVSNIYLSFRTCRRKQVLFISINLIHDFFFVYIY